jgi:hypothetical protein
MRLFTLIALVVLASCSAGGGGSDSGSSGNSSDLVGTWTARAGYSDITFEFQSSGALWMTDSYNFQSNNSIKTCTMVYQAVFNVQSSNSKGLTVQVRTIARTNNQDCYSSFSFYSSPNYYFTPTTTTNLYSIDASAGTMMIYSSDGSEILFGPLTKTSG